MKKYLIAIAMVLTLSSNATATAQKHRHTPRTEQVSDTVKHNPDAIEAFSDTTAAKSNANATAQKHRHTPRTEQVSDTVKHNPDAIEAFSDTTAAKSNANADFDDDDDDYARHHVTLEGEEAEDFIGKIFGGLGIAMIIPILAIVIFGLLLPLIILFTVLYFVNRNRRDKYRLAEMAIKNGQPIPDELLKEVKDDWDSNSYNAGVRQMFTGVGLAIFLGIIVGEMGIGIGALVFFIGLGKWYIARQNRPNGNNGNIQNFNNKESEL